MGVEGRPKVVVISNDNHCKAKMIATSLDRTLQDCIDDAVREWVEKHMNDAAITHSTNREHKPCEP